jgi:hypothetical protein
LVERPVPVPIPEGLRIKTVMKILSIGHGYQWQPIPDDGSQYGAPKTDTMPELLLIGRTLYICREDIQHLERLKHTLDGLKGGGSGG